MPEWTRRLLHRHRQEPSKPRVATDSSTPEVFPTRNSSDVAITAETLSEQLWNEAYDRVKLAERELVDAYEKLLSKRLEDKDISTTDILSEHNVIDQDQQSRSDKMRRLVELGLKKTENAISKKEGVAQGLKAALAVKEVIDKAITASPEAALAWVGVCFALEILMNPSNEASANRQGIAYVTAKMDWYWNLSDLLLDKNRAPQRTQGLQNQLRQKITSLYYMLLRYQMKSICTYFQNSFKTFFRDLVKMDGWEDTLTQIQKTEIAIRDDSAQFNKEQIISLLASIAQKADSDKKELQNIHSAIEQQTDKLLSYQETDKDQQCLKDLCGRNPFDDKLRIERTKGGLLRECSHWIFDHEKYKTWQKDDNCRLLWITGDPGQGKTMLLCDIIDKLLESQSGNEVVSCFFFQAADADLANGVAMLRGLIYRLCKDHPNVIKYVREKWNTQGRDLFMDQNAWFALKQIFLQILESLDKAYIVVDALDECIKNEGEDRENLLDLITQDSAKAPHIKWVFTSRKLPEIENKLQKPSDLLSLYLNPDAEYMMEAVKTYVRSRIDKLSKDNNYSEKQEIKDYLFQHLSSQSNNTFLWVALVCQSLKNISDRNVKREIKRFHSSNLDATYEQIVTQIMSSENEDSEVCKEILGTLATCYRPLSLSELTALVDGLNRYIDEEDIVRDIVAQCNSLVVLRHDRLFFVHQTARDYIVGKARLEIFSSDQEDEHFRIFTKSLAIMAQTLRSNVYDLEARVSLDIVINPVPDPLAPVAYSCVYWLDHLCSTKRGQRGEEAVFLKSINLIEDFLKTHYLHWLEALIIMKDITVGIATILKLSTLLGNIKNSGEVLHFIQDSLKFIRYHRPGIEFTPLQIYSSALIFSPKRSIIRETFKSEEPTWIMVKPVVDDDWGSSMQTFEDHSESVQSVAFSPDKQTVASGSRDNTVKLWDISTGELQSTLDDHKSGDNAVIFSQDSRNVVSISKDNTIKVWVTSNGFLQNVLKGHSDIVEVIAFSPANAQILASGSKDSTIKLWNVMTGELYRTLEGHSGTVTTVAFSSDGKTIASALCDHESDIYLINLWSTTTGALLNTLEDHMRWITCIAFLPDSQTLVSGSRDATVKLWDVKTGELRSTLYGHNGAVETISFSPDGYIIVSGSQDKTIRIWDVLKGTLSRTLEGHIETVNSLSFSPDGRVIASGSQDGTVKLWDTFTGALRSTFKGHRGSVTSVKYSPDGQILASASDDSTVKLWNTSGELSQSVSADNSSWITSMAFSPNGKTLASGSYDSTIQLWDVKTGVSQTVLKGHASPIMSVGFSPDAEMIASGSGDGIIKLWEATGTLRSTLEGHSARVNSVAFSADGKTLASGSGDMTIKLWDVSGTLRNTLEGHTSNIHEVTFSPDGQTIASASDDDTIKLWDVAGTLRNTLKSNAECIFSVAFSPDGQTIASGSEEGTVELWATSTGLLMDTIQADQLVNLLHFAEDGSYVQSNAGALQSHVLSGGSSGQVLSPSPTIAIKDSWITCGRNSLWLPPAYRPLNMAYYRSKVALGLASGRVIFLEFDVNSKQ